VFLWIHRQHPDHARSGLGQIDHAIPTTLAPAWGSPPELAQATGVRDKVSTLRQFDQGDLKLSILLIRQVFLDKSSEELRLNKTER